MPLTSQLVTEFVVDNRNFNSAFSSIQDGIVSVEKKFVATGIAIAAVMAGVTYKIIKTTEEVSNLLDSADQLDITVQQFQELTFAANLVGVSTETASATMAKLNKSAIEAAYGNTKLLNSFAELGINAYSFYNLPIDEKLKLVNEQLKGIQNPIDKDRLAFDLLGRSARDSMNFLKADIPKSKALFNDLGLGIAQNTAIAIDSIGDDFQTLGEIGKSFWYNLLAQAEPYISKVTQFLLEQIKSYGGIKNVAEAAWVAMKDFGINAIVVITGGLIGLVKLFDKIIQMFDIAKNKVNQVKANFLEEKIKNINTETTSGISNTTGQALSQSEIRQLFTDQTQAIRELQDLNKQLAMQKAIDTFGSPESPIIGKLQDFQNSIQQFKSGADTIANIKPAPPAEVKLTIDPSPEFTAKVKAASDAASLRVINNFLTSQGRQTITGVGY